MESIPPEEQPDEIPADNPELSSEETEADFEESDAEFEESDAEFEESDAAFEESDAAADDFPSELFDGESLPGDDVLAVNQEFYRSLESLDLERMNEVWFQTDWVTCVHPGWPMLTGWNEVQGSWRKIFEGTETIRFELSNLAVRIENATAWVTCFENIIHLSTSGVAGAAAVATNIFILTPEGWRMVLHHASPIPDGDDAED
jgi:hypothetical protein